VVALSKLSAIVGALVALMASTASAGHGTAPVPRQVLSLDGDQRGALRLASSATDLGQVGTMWTLAADLRGQLNERFGALVYVPLHRLAGETGVGDSVAGGYVNLLMGAPVSLLVAASIHLPTGDETSAMGQGAFAAEPLIQVSGRVGSNVRVYATGSAIVNLNDSQTFSPLRTRREARGAAGLLYQKSEWQAGGDARLQVPFDDDSEAFVTFAPTAALQVTPELGVELFGEIPLTPNRRIDWRVGVALTYSFAPRPPHVHSHSHAGHAHR